MPSITESTVTLPYHQPEPLTSLPLLYHREHLFPYTSYGDTASAPVDRQFRAVILENATLRVTVLPELGGRVASLFDKRIQREILFRNPVVKPVRILPIWGFISGGMEFNFPIAHSPTSIATVGCQTGRTSDYAFIRVGEREARTGMEWVVELGLWRDEPGLMQRSAFRNATRRAHPWMSWTITAVRSTLETEFVHPPHRVLVHDEQVRESPWPGPGLQWDRTHQQMTALFWKPSSAPQLGVFHHDLGFGLMHWADPAQLPGKKVWTYGHGCHRDWGRATTVGDRSYAELESGPLLDQSEKPLFQAGGVLRLEESWWPVHERACCDNFQPPRCPLPDWPEPWLGWKHSPWQAAWEQFRAEGGPLPTFPVATGLELEEPLRRALTRDLAAAEPLALWLAFHERPQDALAVLEAAPAPTARRLEGLIRWRALGDPAAAMASLRRGPLTEPFAIAELDECLAAMGLHGEREMLLADAPPHRLLTERRAQLALQLGRPEETLRLLEASAWPREHQRYVRTELWQSARAALGLPALPIPEHLHEDSLARFGAYWSD